MNNIRISDAAEKEKRLVELEVELDRARRETMQVEKARLELEMELTSLATLAWNGPNGFSAEIQNDCRIEDRRENVDTRDTEKIAEHTDMVIQADGGGKRGRISHLEKLKLGLFSEIYRVAAVVEVAAKVEVVAVKTSVDIVASVEVERKPSLFKRFKRFFSRKK
jgi:hypothetical protein